MDLQAFHEMEWLKQKKKTRKKITRHAFRKVFVFKIPEEKYKEKFIKKYLLPRTNKNLDKLFKGKIVKSSNFKFFYWSPYKVMPLLSFLLITNKLENNDSSGHFLEM